MQGQQRKGKHQLHQTSVSFKDVIEKKVMQGGREGGRKGGGKGGRDAYALLLCGVHFNNNYYKNYHVATF